MEVKNLNNSLPSFLIMQVSNCVAFCQLGDVWWGGNAIYVADLSFIQAFIK